MSSKELVRSDADEAPDQMLELSSRRDAFMNRIRLLWNPNDGSVHLKISSTVDRRRALDIEVPAEQANDSFEHPYPYAYAAEKRFGQSLVGSLIEVVEVAPVAEAA